MYLTWRSMTASRLPRVTKVTLAKTIASQATPPPALNRGDRCVRSAGGTCSHSRRSAQPAAGWVSGCLGRAFGLRQPDHRAGAAEHLGAGRAGGERERHPVVVELLLDRA